MSSGSWDDRYYAGADSAAPSDSVNTWPKGIIGYAFNTSDQSGITSGSAIDVTSVARQVFVHTSRVNKIHGGCHVTVTGGSGTDFAVECVQGGTTIGRFGRASDIADGGVWQCSDDVIDIDPGNGFHTYKMQIVRLAGSGTLEVSGTSPARAHIEIYDEGSSDQ